MEFYHLKTITLDSLNQIDAKIRKLNVSVVVNIINVMFVSSLVNLMISSSRL